MCPRKPLFGEASCWSLARTKQSKVSDVPTHLIIEHIEVKNYNNSQISFFQSEKKKSTPRRPKVMATL